MPENSWVTRLGPGHGEAVVLDINPVLNRAINQEKQNLALARVKAKEAADAKKQQEDELYKLTQQTRGGAGYLDPFLNEEYQAFQNRIRSDIEANKPLNLNKLKTEYNAMQSAAQQGKEGTDIIKSRFPDYKAQQFIDVPAFEMAYVETLKNKYEAHKKRGGTFASFQYDPEQVAEETLSTTNRPIYDVKAYGKNFRDQIATQGFQEPLRQGATTQSVKAQPVFQMQGGLPTRNLDYDKVSGLIMNDPRGAKMVGQLFETAVSNPDSDYFKQDFENKKAFGEGSPEYQQSRGELMKQFAKNDFLETAGITPESFVYEPGQTLSRPFASRGAGKKQVTFAQGPETTLTIGQVPVKQGETMIPTSKSHDAPVSYFSAPVEGIPIEIALTYDRNLAPQSANGTSRSYTVASDNIGVTAQPFASVAIKSGDKTIKPGTGLNISNIRNQLGTGPYSVTYKDGTTRTYRTLESLFSSDAVSYDPMYVVTPAIQLSGGSAQDKALATAMGIDLPVTGVKATLDKRLVKARNAPELEMAVLQSEGGPDKATWEAKKQAAVQSAKESLLRQVKSKSSAERLKNLNNPIPQKEARKPSNNDF